MPLRNVSIRHKVVVIIMITTGAALLLASAALIFSDQLRFRQDITTDLYTVSAIIAENSTAALAFSDPEAATETLGALRSNSSIVAGCIYDGNQVFAQYSRDGGSANCPPAPRSDGMYREEEFLAVVEPIRLNDQRIGTIYVRSDLQQVSDRLRLQVITTLAVLVGALAFAFVISSWLQRVISRPIRNLAGTMRKVSERQDYSLRGIKQGQDELGGLVDSFNAMLSQIQERDRQLRSAKTELEFRVAERTEALQQQLHEKQRTQEELVKVNAELVQSNRELDDFAYIASHDLKEPLRGIYSYSVFMIEDYGDKIDAEGHARLETLKRLTQRMETLIDALLHYSRVGRLELAFGMVDLNGVLLEVLESLRVRLMEGAADVRVPRPLPVEYCDRTRVGEIFQNLISNGVKYNDKPQKWVEVGYMERERERVYYVRDNGIGIPAKHQDSIFRIFRRLHARDKFGGGAGAGLTIVKKIVERHKGAVWLESTEGEGTTFFFTLHAGKSTADSRD